MWSHCCLPPKFCCVPLIVFHYLIIILSEEQHWGVFLKLELLARYKSLSSFFFLHEFTTKFGIIVAYPTKFCCVPLIVCHYLIIILPEEQHCKSISSMKAVSYWPEPRHFELGCSMLTAGLLPPPQCAGCKFL